MNLHSLHIKILYSSLFAISMAYIESSVVVYLRELFPPEGLDFTLSGIPDRLLLIEIGREASTILLLFAFAKSVGRNGREVIAYFAYNFGVWDIWYYIWLKILLNWPVSIWDWDILFLIPITWVGPVIAPVLVSLALIWAGYIILRYESLNKPIRLTKTDWILEISSGIIIILSFITQIKDESSIEVPEDYPWWLFLFGLIFGLVVFVRRLLKSIRSSRFKGLN